MGEYNEVEIRVTARDDTGRALKAAEDNIDDVKISAGKADRAVKSLGDSVKTTASKTEDLGTKAQGAARDVGHLDRRITDLKGPLVDLASRMNETGDTKLLKQFRADSAELAGLTRMRREVGGLGDEVKKLGREGASTAMTFGSLFQGGLISALKTPQGAAAAAAVAAPAAIGAGAAAGGATLAGAGLGAVGLGVAGVADSKEVGAAWTQTAAEVEAAWRRASQPFVGPVVAAAHEFRDAFASIDLDRMLGKAAMYVEPLARGAATFARSVGAGVSALVENAGPEIDAVADGLVELGRAAKIAMEEISDGSEGGAEAIRDLAHAVAVVVTGIGGFIGSAEKAYDTLKDFNVWIADTVDHLRDTNGVLWASLGPAAAAMSIFDPRQPAAFGEALRDTEGNVRNFGAAGTETFVGLDQKMQNALDTVKRLNHDFGELFGQIMDQREAAIAAEQAVDDLTAGWQRGAGQLDITTQKGRDNLDLVNSTISAYNDQREAAIRAGGGTQEAYDKANAAYRAQLAALENMLVKLGLTRAQAHALVNEFAELAKPLTKTITVRVHQVGSVSAEGVVSGRVPNVRGSAYAHGGIVGAAAGGIRDGLVQVAEQGRELALLAPGRAVLPPGSQVIPAGTTETMMRGGTGWGGQPAPTQVLLGSDGSRFGDLLVDLIATTVRSQGGRPEQLGLKAT